MERRSEGMTIGAAAQAAGVHVETLRYYQRLGLVAEPARPGNGFRRYGEDTVARLRFIRRSQELGFSLEETRNLLRLADGGSCEATRRLAEAKLAAIEARLRDLQRMRRALAQLVSACAGARQAPPCPIIAALASGAVGAGSRTRSSPRA
jgi:MerR family mercuric resistance operon transcriptional regulator